ncbi:MAG TPA: c-type cytochrome [Edaphobacter sp.]|nr:c-type cytochrome [Edaphobacter sp.]
MKPPLFAGAILGIAASLALAGCNEGQEPRTYVIATGGNPEHGKQLIQSYGCGACHIVPGVHGARGLVGPPLFYLSQRTMIAGELPNTPDDVARWIEHPKSVNPKTAMPDLGLTEDQAYDIAAYLYTLRGAEGTRWID